MAKVKPKVFFGSSVESLDLARTLQAQLQHEIAGKVWAQGVFRPSKDAISSLTEELNKSDFGVFILSADDIAKIRKDEFSIPRDNLIFELGLYIGKLGKDRAFIVTPRNQADFHLPSDLIGLTPITYDLDDVKADRDSGLGPVATAIINEINLQFSPTAKGDKAEKKESKKDREPSPAEPLERVVIQGNANRMLCEPVDRLDATEIELLNLILQFGGVNDFAMTCSEIKARMSLDDFEVHSVAMMKLRVRGLIQREPGRIEAYSITQKGWQWIRKSAEFVAVPDDS